MKLEELAREVGGMVVSGDPGLELSGARGLDDAGPGDVAFLEDPRQAARIAASHAGAVLLPNGVDAQGRAAIAVKKPKLAFARALGLFFPEPVPPVGVHPTAIVAASAEIAPSASVGPYCYVGEGAVIGAGASLLAQVYVGKGSRLEAGCWICPGVRLLGECVVDEGTRLHACSTFGQGTVLGARVEVGARCSLGNRVQIGEGTKMDNMVSIADGARIGRHTILVSYSHFEPDCAIGDGCLVAGQVWVGKGRQVGNRCVLTGRTYVYQDVPDRSFIAGAHGRPHKDELRLQAWIQQLPELVAARQA